MNDTLNLLITLLCESDMTLLRVGVSLPGKLVPKEVQDAPLEPENSQRLRSMLPLYIRDMPIVDVEEIFDVIDLTEDERRDLVVDP